MQRDSGLLNDITGCFPLTWSKCEVCGREFKFERGWMYWVRHCTTGYFCKKCCKTKEDVVKGIT